MKQLALIKILSAATIICAADVPISQEELPSSSVSSKTFE
jgi:hypothetical protein